MKIWIDFINTPQVSFFIPFIKEFNKDNDELLLTCRDSGNTVELLKLNGLNYHVIGEKVRKGTISKLFFFPLRIIQLISFIRKHKPDIAVSQSSFYQPVVARICGIPSLYTNDNEHAKGNLIAFLFASKVILPKMLGKLGFTKKWPLKSKLSFYPSVKEAIYLSQQPELKSFLTGKKEIIYFRPEPWSAQYYSGPVNFFDETLIKLTNKYSIVVLPRDPNQREHYSQSKFGSMKVVQKSLSLQTILSDCLLFIGAGGSMTRELAVLGIPVISIYQADLLEVDKYLVEKGLMTINSKVSFNEIIDFIESNSQIKKENIALMEGNESFNLIKYTIANLKK